jgi:hypothetical protein
LAKTLMQTDGVVGKKWAGRRELSLLRTFPTATKCNFKHELCKQSTNQEKKLKWRKLEKLELRSIWILIQSMEKNSVLSMHWTGRAQWYVHFSYRFSVCPAYTLAIALPFIKCWKMFTHKVHFHTLHVCPYLPWSLK